MGDTQHQFGLSKPQPTHPTKHSCPQPFKYINAQKNNVKTICPDKRLTSRYNSTQQANGNVFAGSSIGRKSATGSVQNYTPNLDLSSLSFPNSERLLVSAPLVESSTKIKSNIPVINECSLEDQPLQHSQMEDAKMYLCAHTPPYLGMFTPPINPPQQQCLTCDHQHMAPYIVTSSRHPEYRNISAERDVYLRHTYNHYNSAVENFHCEHKAMSRKCYLSYPMMYCQMSHRHGLDFLSPVTGTGKSQTSLSHDCYDRNMQQPIKPRDLIDYNNDIIRETAHSFVDAFCPLLGERPYCLPPVKKYSHTDKQLVHEMESENRVLGSFEHYFAEHQIPVFMLCHYPLSGFMQVYQNKLGRDSESLRDKNCKDTVTLLLLSHVFRVTILTVSIMSHSSDMIYIQKGVQKAAMHMKRCSAIVSKWLTSLGVKANIKEIIAFPNLKKTALQSIIKDQQFQQIFGSLCTLHASHLLASFEEELSTNVYKHSFNKWMKQYILCHGPTLSRDELRLVVGALLSPRLSKVEYVHEEKPIMPITESTSYSVLQENTVEDVSQLKLTIDGVTKTFDTFMDEYVLCYYPDVENQTYRVPPIHFNIQSFKKPSELNLLNDSSAKKVPVVPWGNESKVFTKCFSHCASEENCISSRKRSDHSQNSLFMPPCCTFTMSVRRNSNSSTNEHHMKIDTVPCENGHGSDLLVEDSSKILAEVEISPGHRNEPKEKVSDSTLSMNGSANQTLASTSPFIRRSFITSAQASPAVSSPQQSPDLKSHNRRKLSSSSVNRSPASARLEALKDVVVLSEVMAKDARADEGESRVISALEMLGHRLDPMFIICGYQYNNYLNKLREEMFSKEEKNRPIRAFGQIMRAEHDCLIFHKKYGAIVICIKAIGDNFEEWGASEEQKIDSTIKILEKAVNQLDREEAMIRHVTSDLHATLACHKLIALPNMTRENVDKALKTNDRLMKKIKTSLGHGAELFLCSDELPPKHQVIWDYEDQNLWKTLENWWENVQKLFIGVKIGEISSKIYRQLIGRYTGLLSTVEVWSPTNPRVEVRSESEAVNICAQRFCKMVLLPHQIEALCSNERRVFLYGPPGCGKTLVLILKAREWLLAGETVVLINARPGSLHGFPYAYGVLKKLQQMMKDSEVNSFKLRMINIDSLQFKADDLNDIMPSCCIIMDEVTAASHEIIEHLSCLQVKNIWCAGLFIDDKPITALGFAAFMMDKILRCPPIVQSLLKHTEKDVKLITPYKNIYQGSMLTRNRIIQRDGSAVSDGRIYDSENKECILSTNSEVRNEHRRVSEKSSESQSVEKCFPGIEQLIKLAPEQVLFVENHNMERTICKDAPKPDSELVNGRLFQKSGSDLHLREWSENTNQPEIYIPGKSTRKTSFHDVSNGNEIKKVLCDLKNLDNEPHVKTDASRRTYDHDSQTLDKRYQDKYDSRTEIGEDMQDTVKLENIISEKSSTQTNTFSVSVGNEFRKLIDECTNSGKDTANNRLSEKYGNKSEISDKVQGRRQKKTPDIFSDKTLTKESSLCMSDDTCKEILSGPDSLDKRLKEKYSCTPQNNEESQKVKQLEFTYPSPHNSTVQISLPTDGPRPHIIDHRCHSQPGNPTDCFECGFDLAKFLESMIRPSNMSTHSSRNHQGQDKKNYVIKVVPSSRSRSGKTSDTVLFSNTSSVHTKSSAFSCGQKLHASFDDRALTWSDMLIVGREMPKDCNFVTVLRSRNIPVEILMSGNTSEIEVTSERKLFMTSYKEVTGMERAVIVFCPSECPDQLQQTVSTPDELDLQLGHSINRFTEEDRRALWYVASRSLASLVLILP